MKSDDLSICSLLVQGNKYHMNKRVGLLFLSLVNNMQKKLHINVGHLAQ